MRKYIIKIIALMVAVCVIFCACDTSGNELNYPSGNDGLNEPSELHTHLFNKKLTVKKPTCTEEGFREAYCSCGEKQITFTSALGHDYISHEAKAAGCTNSGWQEYSTCSRCDYNDFAEIPAHGHLFGKWEVTEEATCKGGTETRVCEYDSTHTETRELQPTGHRPSGWIISEKPDCESDGLQIKICEDCSTELEREIIPSPGHKFGEWEVLTASTCTRKGVLKRICKNDESHIETSEADFADHKYKWQSDDETHTEVCEECGSIGESAPHEWTDGVCSVCGFVAPVPQLSFVIIDGVSYSVSGIGEVTQTEIIIPSEYKGLPVTAIGSGAFRDCGFVTSITIPDTVTIIGEGAFSNCEKLAGVIFENPEGWSVYKNDSWQGEIKQLSDSVLALKQLKLYYDCVWKRI